MLLNGLIRERKSERANTEKYGITDELCRASKWDKNESYILID